jgi:hypothetical protein
VILRDLYALESASEYHTPRGIWSTAAIIANGQKIYARTQGFGTQTGFSMTAYCVGG